MDGRFQVIETLFRSDLPIALPISPLTMLHPITFSLFSRRPRERKASEWKGKRRERVNSSPSSSLQNTLLLLSCHRRPALRPWNRHTIYEGRRAERAHANTHSLSHTRKDTDAATGAGWSTFRISGITQYSTLNLSASVLQYLFLLIIWPKNVWGFPLSSLWFSPQAKNG